MIACKPCEANVTHACRLVHANMLLVHMPGADVISVPGLCEALLVKPKDEPDTRAGLLQVNKALCAQVLGVLRTSFVLQADDSLPQQFQRFQHLVQSLGSAGYPVVSAGVLLKQPKNAPPRPQPMPLPPILSAHGWLAKLTIQFVPVTAVTNMASLRELTVAYCDELREVCNLPSLTHLSVDGCVRLAQISNVPALSSLNLFGRVAFLPRAALLPTLLESIPKLTALKDVLLVGQGIECVSNLNELPALQSLGIVGCRGHQLRGDELRMPALEFLCINTSQGTLDVSSLPALQRLMVSNFHGPITVSNLPRLRCLDLFDWQGDVRICNLPALEQLAALAKGSGVDRGSFTVSNVPPLKHLDINIGYQ